MPRGQDVDEGNRCSRTREWEAPVTVVGPSADAIDQSARVTPDLQSLHVERDGVTGFR